MSVPRCGESEKNDRNEQKFPHFWQRTENQRMLDSIANRENENQSQPYSVSASVILSPTLPMTNPVGIFNPDIGRKQLDFNSEHIQCMCEALQQKGDIEKLSTLLYHLPKHELVRENDIILR